MNPDAELRKFQFVLYAGILFLISGCYSLEELKYRVFSSRAEGTVTRTYIAEKSGRRGRSSSYLAIEYTFQDATGQSRSGRDSTGTDVAIAEGQQVTVQYFPSKENSARIAALASLGAVYFFLGSVALGVVAIGYLVWEANAPIAKSPQRRRF